METEYRRLPVRGYEGLYEIDTNGTVFSLISNSTMKGRIGRGGYPAVILWKDGKRKNKYIHRMVAEAFIPNPNNYPQINHLDETRTNNSVLNLEWCTAKQNANYGTAIERRRRQLIGRPEPEWKKKAQSERMKQYWKTHRHPRQIVDIECLNDHKVFRSYCEAAREYGISRSSVKRMCDKGTSENGLNFRYFTQEVIK